MYQILCTAREYAQRQKMQRDQNTYGLRNYYLNKKLIENTEKEGSFYNDNNLFINFIKHMKLKNKTRQYIVYTNLLESIL
jgi:hypothetical protein